MKQPDITVGIMSRSQIDFTLNGKFILNQSDIIFEGDQSVGLGEGKLKLYQSEISKT